MNYFDVFVVDRSTKAEVCVGCLLSRSEATAIKRFFEDYDIDCYFIEYFYYHGRRIEKK